jgi:hypothetical protein
MEKTIFDLGALFVHNTGGALVSKASNVHGVALVYVCSVCERER